MVSPMARDMPSITAVPMPDSAEGITTRISVSHRVAPRASDASRSVRGTANSASSATEQMVGTLMNASMSAAFSRLSPVSAPNQSCRKGATMTMPKKPMTTEGNAASSSTNGLTMRRVRLAAISAR